MRLGNILASVLGFSLTVLMLASDSPAAQSETPARFRIGAILALTGPAAEYGVSMKNSIELAKRQHPELFSNIDILYEDAAYDARQAVSAFQKLKDSDRVDLVYVWGVSFCKAVAPLAEAARLPMVGQCIDPETSAGRHFVIRFMNYTDEYLQTQVEYLRKQGWKHYGMVMTDNAYLEEMYKALERSIDPTRGESAVIADRYQASQMDFRSTLSKLRNAHYDAVGVFLSAGQISQFYKQAQERHVALHTFGTNFFESTGEIKAAGGAMDGALFSNNLIRQGYLDAYQEAYGQSTQVTFGALAYDFALTIGGLVSQTKTKPSGEDLLQQILNLKAGDAPAGGRYTVVDSPNAGRYFRFELVVKSIKGGSFVPASAPEAGLPPATRQPIE